MGDKDLWLKFGLIVAVVALSVSFIWPPEDKLKPGIDLGGGHSLLFEIDDTGEGMRSDLAARVMDILKQRVDPGGNRNLIWRPIGRNRLEIQMPQPPARQRESREAYDKARQALADTQITRSQILKAIEMPAGPARDKAVAQLVGKVPARQPLLKSLTESVDRYNQLLAATSQPESASQPASAPAIDVAKAQEMDKLFVRRNELVGQLLQTNLDPRVLHDLLELDRKSEVRRQRLEEMRKSHADLLPLIDNMVATHEAWAKQKGYLDDPADLMRLLKGAGKLEFRILAERDRSTGRIYSNRPEYQESIDKYTEQLAKYGPRPQENDKFQWFEISKPEENNIAKSESFIVQDYLGKKYVLAYATDEMGLLNKGRDDWKLRRAMVGRDKGGALAVDFELDTRGGNKFADLTGNNIDRPLCIFLDEKAISSATIRSQINTNGQISGRFSQQEVANLVNTLEAGVLPARLKEVPLQEKSVGPGLGATNIRQGIQATAIALLVTLLFMAVYYTYSGMVANVALILNFVITLGCMAFLGNTFTLPGIAGLILTLGMAVDANVLIYERLREELDRGVSVRMAMRLGYEKAFSAILDGNVTTIITAVILAYLGSEEIKGFGQTLGLGLCISMFTALFVTRQYFNVMLPTTVDRQDLFKIGAGTVAFAALGGVFMALGYAMNVPELRAESPLTGFGKLCLIFFGTAVVILGSMWLFRLVYHATGHARANRMPMMKLLSPPHVDWMSKRHYFWAGSAVVVGAGLLFAWAELRFQASRILDIEFVGGTSVQVEVKDAKMTDEQLTEQIVGNGTDKTNAVGWLRNAAAQLASAQVSKLDDTRYKLTLGDSYTTSQMEALLTPVMQRQLARNGVRSAAGGFELQFNPDATNAVKDADTVKSLLQSASGYARQAADRMRQIRVQLVKEETAEDKTRNAFEIITTETSKQLVAESLMVSTRDLLEVTHPIEAKLVTDPSRAADGLFPVKQSDNVLADVLGPDASGAVGQESIAPFKGGVVLVYNQITPAVTTGELQQRLKDMRLQPDLEAPGREFKVLGIQPATPGGSKFTKVAVVVSDPSIPFVEEGKSNDAWRTQVAEKEKSIADAAFATSRSLQRVTQFAPQVATEAAMKAIIAILISLIAIAIYMWARFGSAEFGLSGIIALYHDVAVALSAVIVSHVLYDTPIGHLLGLRDFRIDLSVIAALLTIVGFSINDTIVIFDRIRENRGRTAAISSDLVNRSLNETMSRTIITTLTVLMTVVVMYIWGGEGIHAFAFTMLVGCISGTYSTIAIATPLVHTPRTMWLVTIVITTATLAGLATAVETPWVQTMFLVLILAGGAYSVFRTLRNFPAGRGQLAAGA